MVVTAGVAREKSASLEDSGGAGGGIDNERVLRGWVGGAADGDDDADDDGGDGDTKL